ncbi:MAG TPA: class I SAM-dependent methyltransferase [Acidobacteriaceae bacterium]
MTDRDRWNAKFVAGEAQLSEPDPLLLEACSDLPPGNALDLAGGAGRHAIWLAQHGWRVLLTDVSDEGLALAAQRSAEAAVALTFRRESVEETLAWATKYQDVYDLRFDLITVFLFLAREHFSALPLLLAPGGRLIYKTCTSEHRRFQERHSLAYALHPGELGKAFPALETILYREADGIAELVAKRS